MKKIKKPTADELIAEFKKVEKTLQSTDYDDLFSIFKAGVDYTLYLNSDDIFRNYVDLGFDIDLKEIYNLMTDTSDGSYWESNIVKNILFESVVFKMVGLVKYMHINFSATSSYGMHKNLLIIIDSYGKVDVKLPDTPWELGNVTNDIITILMKYTTKQKYFNT